MKIKSKYNICIHENCKTQPSFNFEGEKKPIYCSIHKLDSMIDITHKTCIHENCKKRPNFNFEGEKKPLYCAIHKLESMIDITHKTCSHENCKTRPSFNFEGQKKPLYCAIHKLDSMIDIVNKTCIHENCKKKPSFNFEGQKNPLYCSIHKLDSMIDITHKTCIHENCKTQPSFNFEGEKKPLYCATHKLDSMIDIVSKTCIHENCKTRPNFNFEGEKKPLYCATHKLDSMINIVDKTCKTHLCYTQVTEKYEGYCLYCYINTFPDKPVSRNYKTKEFSVVEYVKNNFPEFDWISDKIIKGGCSKRRPDLLLDLGYQIIIIEIDENQHIDYDCTCENKRVMELSKDLDHRPIIFIRFNPDDYRINGKNITSCWSIDKKGICVIKKSKNNEWNKRLETLKEQIIYWSNPTNKIDKTIEIIQLFYDQN
jgi:hypothetical protein